MNADGTGAPLRLTPPSLAQVTPDVMFSAPAWSLDGALIAYSSIVADGGSHVFVVSSQGGDPQDVSGSPGVSDWSPAWSPGGDWLAWRAGQDGVPGQFVVARPDGTERSVLPPAVAGAPVWSPDGRQLIGSSNNPASGTTDQLIVIDVEAGTSIAIPAQLAGDPSWQRLAP
jgi:TolB protein